MTDLRRRMIEDMRLHGLAEATQRTYLDAIANLARHFKRSPDQLTDAELRQFFVHLTQTQRRAKSTVRVHLFAIKFLYHSCRNRSCPKCHAADTQAWLADRRKELLPVGYFHLGFTLPEELRLVARSHQTVIYGLMMKAAAASLIKLAADPHYVGGLLGVLTVLHTWSRTLTYHPHVHCLVPAGGVTDDGRWVPARSKYLVPVTALSKIFRGMFKDLVTAALPDVQFPPSVWRRDWVVYCRPAVQGPDRVLGYLGRYVHRIAITNSRILSIGNGQVAFRYQNTGESCWRTMTLTADEFIRRFLQPALLLHVWSGPRQEWLQQPAGTSRTGRRRWQGDCVASR